MADLKKSTGQQFMKDLRDAAQNKKALLDLAADAIKLSHEKAKYSERGISNVSAALDMQAAFIYTKMNAPTNGKICTLNKKDLSTDQRLILIKHLYQKMGHGNFDEDFRIAHPKEYGVKIQNNKHEHNNQVINPAVRRAMAGRQSLHA